MSFLLAEQNTNMALKYARYGYILENGRVVMDGEAKALRENEDVKEFYLGVAEGKRKIVPRREALQAAEALAGLRPARLLKPGLTCPSFSPSAHSCSLRSSSVRSGGSGACWRSMARTVPICPAPAASSPAICSTRRSSATSRSS